jgi:CheY-like chemotaxis protein
MTKILVVEDDPTLQEAYKIVLGMDKSFEIEVAGDGIQALEILRDYQPDVILLDMHMPHMNGLEFLEAYNPPNHPQTKVIVFSNIVTPEQTNQALELGASEYLTKSSFTPTSILEKLHEVIASQKTKKK